MKSIALIKNETKLIKPFSLDMKYSRIRGTKLGGAAHTREHFALLFIFLKQNLLVLERRLFPRDIHSTNNVAQLCHALGVTTFIVIL